MRKYLRAWVWVAATCGVARAQAVCDQIRTLVADPTVAAAHWGVAVTTLDGTPVCGVNEGQLFRPASNNKIFSSATALALLGPDRRFTTRVVAEGDLKSGVLRGDLMLVGGGDANFGSHDVPYLAPSGRPKNAAPEPGSIADIEELADQVAAKGLKRVQGDVVGTDGEFAWEPYPPDWAEDDLVYGYGAPVSALTIHDNQMVVQVAPNPRPGGIAVLKTTPEMPYYVIANRVETEQTGQDCDAQLQYRRAPGAKLLNVFGAMAPGAPPCSQTIAIHDPAEYAAIALKAALERRGVRVTGIAKAKHFEVPQVGGVFAGQKDDRGLDGAFAQPPPQPVSCSVESNPNSVATRTGTELATHSSPTLIEDITYTNKVSQNLHAELLMRNVGVAYCQNTQRGGLHVVRQYLLHAGLAPNDFVLYDGSGLSGHDLVAPRAMAKFLSFAAKQPWFASWEKTLPEGGVDGGLTTRFAGPMKARVFAKTGTLGESRALSGYVTTTGGATLIFSIMVDTHLPGGSADRVVMDKIVEAIAASN